ncbi:MAG: hypothetical protein ACM3XM_04455 [Mycobacterium leprae]
MNVKTHVVLLGLTLCLTVLSVAAGSLLPAPAWRMKVDWITDVTDDRKLVGVCHHVFVGRVVARAWTSQSNGDLPDTEFRVQVVQNIKGNLAGTVIVKQSGGWAGRALHLFGDDPLLTVGKSYLFVTRQGPAWQRPVPGYGDIPINSEAEMAALVQRFTEAVQHEVPWPDSVINP